MSKFFSISDGLNKFGPFDKNEIESMVFESKLSMMDLIYDSRTKKWLKIMLHSDFVNDEVEQEVESDGIAGLMPDRATVDGEKLKKEGHKELAITEIINAVKEEDKKKQIKVFNILQDGIHAEVSRASDDGNNELLELADLDAEKWYLKEGGMVLGPYHFLSILTMLRDGTLDENNFLRKGKKGAWQIATSAFTQSELKHYSIMTPDKKKSLLASRGWQRTNLRRDFDLLFYVNDGKSEYIVQGFDISENGIAFVTMLPCFSLGQKLACSLVVSVDNVVRAEGVILRVEKVDSQQSDMQLTKYALKVEAKIDLSRIFKDSE